MKEGRSLQDVATELDRQRAAKRDFLADTRNLRIEIEQHVDRPPALQAEILESVTDPKRGGRQYGVNLHALRQIEDYVGLPAKFGDRLMAKHPDLLSHNLNELLYREPKPRLIRTLDGNIRAFLSNSYRMIDNFDFANAVLEVAGKFNVRIASCQVTEHRLYIKVVREDLVERIGFEDHFRMGEGHNFFDEIQAAAVFSNSEIGSGSLWFRPGVFTRKCTNLAVFEQDSFSKVHLGKAGDVGESGFWEILSDRTKQLSDAALWSQVKDLAAAALDGALFAKQVERLKEARGQKLQAATVAKTLELAAKTFNLSEGESGGILGHLIQGGDLTQYGLHSAITRFSADVDDYDRASELERLGGRIIELPQDQWKRLAEAA